MKNLFLPLLASLFLTLSLNAQVQVPCFSKKQDLGISFNPITMVLKYEKKSDQLMVLKGKDFYRGVFDSVEIRCEKFLEPTTYTKRVEILNLVAEFEEIQDSVMLKTTFLKEEFEDFFFSLRERTIVKEEMSPNDGKCRIFRYSAIIEDSATIVEIPKRGTGRVKAFTFPITYSGRASSVLADTTTFDLCFDTRVDFGQFITSSETEVNVESGVNGTGIAYTKDGVVDTIKCGKFRVFQEEDMKRIHLILEALEEIEVKAVIPIEFLYKYRDEILEGKNDDIRFFDLGFFLTSGEGFAARIPKFGEGEIKIQFLKED